MKLTQAAARRTMQDPCKGSVNSLAACYLEHTLQQGKSIEIPSLGIVIKESASTKKYCNPEDK